MTDNKNFCVSSLYDLLVESENMRWEGSRIHLKRPDGLSDLHKIAFRNFKGELQPFTNLNIPELKADVLIMSNGLKQVDMTGEATYDLPGHIQYKDTELNKILTINKAWTYNEESEEGQVIENIKELFNIVNASMNDYFKASSIFDVFKLSDFTDWATLTGFYNIPNPLDPSYSPLIVDTSKNIYYYDSDANKIDSFKLTCDYMRGYPHFNGSDDMIITMTNGAASMYAMEIKYGTFPNTVETVYLSLYYSTSYKNFDGAGPGNNKYYQNYIIDYPYGTTDRYPVILYPNVSHDNHVYQLCIKALGPSPQQTEMLRFGLETYRETCPRLEYWAAGNMLIDIIPVHWSTCTTTQGGPPGTKIDNCFLLLKVRNDFKDYYVVWIGELILTWDEDKAFTISSLKEDAVLYYDDDIAYGQQIYYELGGYGDEGQTAKVRTAFDGPLILTAPNSLPTSAHSFIFPSNNGIIWIPITPGQFSHLDWTPYYTYVSNIIDGYFNDKTHILGKVRIARVPSTSQKYYKAENLSWYNSISYRSWDDTPGTEFYNIDKTYGQFLCGGPILFYDSGILPKDYNNAVRVETFIKTSVKCVGTDQSDNAVYMSPRQGDYITIPYSFSPFKVLEMVEANNEITGGAEIPQIYFNSDYAANIVLKIYTNPYYFELLTEKNYSTSFSSNNMDSIETNLKFRASNDTILSMLEYLILIRYNNNNIILKCSGFPNNDGAVFNINDESRINFKTMITDNTQQEIIITLEGNDGTPITKDLLKQIYAHCCVSIDWIQ